MKTFISSAMVSFLSMVGSAAFADHAVENAQYISQLAYDAADWAEALASEAQREGGWRDDHRGENLSSIAQAADGLHYALSDLYRAARFNDDEAPGTDDHRGDRIRDSFERTQQYYNQLSQAWQNLSPYQLSSRLQSLYFNVYGSYSRLSNYIYGGPIR